MKKLVILVLLCIPGLLHAQDHFDPGTYWEVTAVDTKPAMFDAYIENLDGLWRKQMEMLIEDGKVVSYKMFANVDARDGEPDLWLLVEWSSAAARLDTPTEYWDELTEKLTGSLDASRERAIARGEIRTIMSQMMLREFTFKD